jgi:hypothetical protein
VETTAVDDLATTSEEGRKVLHWFHRHGPSSAWFLCWHGWIDSLRDRGLLREDSHYRDMNGRTPHGLTERGKAVMSALVNLEATLTALGPRRP